MPGELAQGVVDCGGKAGAATPLSDVGKLPRFDNRPCIQKRRGAALPAAVQDDFLKPADFPSAGRLKASKGRL